MNMLSFASLQRIPLTTPRRAVRARSTGGSEGNDSPLGEDLIARLKAAEEEAQALRRELAAAKAQSDASSSDTEAENTPPVKASRIDGGDLRRETLAFVESKPRNWLSESDVEFFTGAGPSEAEGVPTTSEEESSIVKRRLLIGLALTAGLGAFALIPTEKLQPPPSKPLFFYLTPIVRVQGILDEVERIIPEGNYQSLKTLLSLIEGSPNNIQTNLRSAAASLPDSSKAQQADTVARDVYEYLKGIDYQTYYESMPGGKDQQKLFEYSLKSTKAAKIKLTEFLNLMPRDQVEAAQQQVDAFASR